jgi:hypothetical protein
MPERDLTCSFQRDHPDCTQTLPLRYLVLHFRKANSLVTFGQVFWSGVDFGLLLGGSDDPQQNLDGNVS